MDDRTRFLILSLGGESYALPITKLLEITVPRGIQKDNNLTSIFEGKIEYRDKLIPVLNLNKIFRLPGKTGTVLLVIKSTKGILGLLVEAVNEMMDTDKKPVAVPRGVMNPSLQYYSGVLRHKEKILLVLNEDGLLP